MFQNGEGAAYHMTEKAFHGEVEIGVIVVHSAKEMVRFNVRRQFFFDFPLEGVFRRFAFFYLAAGEFPAAFKFSVAPSGGEDLISFGNDCRRYMDGFHRSVTELFFSKR